MKRLAAASVALGMTVASCSGGHSAGSLLPSGAQNGPTTQSAASSSPSAAGLRTTRGVAVAAVPAGWAATATQAIAPRTGSDQGALPASQQLTVHLGLQLRNVDGLKSSILSHAIMSPGQVLSAYGPSAADVSKVTSYLQTQGFTSVGVSENRLIVSATAPAATVAKAFSTTLHSFGGGTFANTTPAYVPQSLGGIVVAVLGLSNLQAFTVAKHPVTVAINHASPSASAPAPQPESPCAVSSVYIIGLPSPQPVPAPVAGQVGCPRNYTPSDYWRAYDANTTPAASSVKIAILTEGNPRPAIGDFRINEQGDGLPQVPVGVKDVGLAGSDTSADAEGEWTLDMTASSGMAGNLQAIKLYAATSFTDSDIALMFNKWVEKDEQRIANASFGGCEVYPYLDGSMLLDDEIFAEGAAQGQTLFASTGDTGSFCSVGNPNGVPGGAPLVEYPAASPYVVAVGGTTLWSTVPGAYQGESAWSAGGGGISQFEYSPSWQSGIQPASSTPVGFTFRGLPDVSMDGDLQTGMIMYMQGSWTVIGGTSLSSPLMAGVWARMLQAHPGLTYAPPALYGTFAASASSATNAGPPPTATYGPFHDVLSGANGLYSAAPGYDYTTGLGSVDVDALSAALH
jgi:subtilase family serine protease